MYVLKISSFFLSLLLASTIFLSHLLKIFFKQLFLFYYFKRNFIFFSGSSYKENIQQLPHKIIIILFFYLFFFHKFVYFKLFLFFLYFFFLPRNKHKKIEKLFSSLFFSFKLKASLLPSFLYYNFYFFLYIYLKYFFFFLSFRDIVKKPT